MFEYLKYNWSIVFIKILYINYCVKLFVLFYLIFLIIIEFSVLCVYFILIYLIVTVQFKENQGITLVFYIFTYVFHFNDLITTTTMMK